MLSARTRSIPPRYIDARCPCVQLHAHTQAHARTHTGQQGLDGWAHVQAGVRGSDKFVLVMSEQYFEREFCLKELRWAQQYNKEVRASTPTNDPNNGSEYCEKGA